MNLYALIEKIGGKRERGKRKVLKFCSHFTLINKDKQKMKKKKFIYIHMYGDQFKLRVLISDLTTK